MTDSETMLLDADGVLLGFIPYFAQYLSAVHGIHAAIDPNEETDYDLSGMYPDISDEALQPYYQAIGLNEEWFSRIPFIEGAVEGVTALREAFPHRRIVCVTACGTNPVTREFRLRNLAPLGLDDIITVPMNTSKREVLSRYKPGWFVDDLPHHVAAAEEVGHIGILMTQAYNKKDATTRRASNWAEVVQIIRNFSPFPRVGADL